MTFKHINFSDSPVMRELEKIARAKGEFNSSSVESVVKKVAASKPKKKVSYEPSEDLMQDILKLADGLRAKGFEKQADSLETKFLDYKKAETHLYRAIDEDGEDVIGFAHPHAAKPISDSEHAKVPNILEKHKKIVDIVNKQPTGKYAADVADIVKDAEDILGLKKKAQVPVPDLVVPGAVRAALPFFTVPSAGAAAVAVGTVAAVSIAIGALVASGYLTYEFFVYNITDLLDAGKKLAEEFDQVGVVSEIPDLTSAVGAANIPAKFKESITEIEKIYKDRDPENIAGLLKETEEARNLAARISSMFAETGPSIPYTDTPGISVHKLAQNFVEVADKTMRAWQSMLAGKLAELKEANPEEYKKIIQNMAKPETDKTMIDFVKKVPGVSMVNIDAALAAKTAKRLNDLSARSLQIGDNNNNVFKVMASIFSDPKALTVPWAQILYNLERAGLEDIQQYKTSENFTQNFINYWENEYRTKNASKKTFEKTAVKGRPVPGGDAENISSLPGFFPINLNKAKPGQQQARPSPDAQEPEKSAVQRMQMILNKLGMELASNSKNKEFANILIATGPKGAETIDQFDGKWGPNTDKAVQAAAKLGIEGMTPGATYSYKSKSKEEVDAAAKKAEQNKNIIVQYMNAKGMGEKIPVALKKKRTYKTLDNIKQGSVADDAWVTEEEYEGPGIIPITTADLLSFSDFDKLIKRSGLTGEGFQEMAVQAPAPQQQTPQAQSPQTGKPALTEQEALQQGIKPTKINLGSFIQSIKLLKSAQAIKTGRTKSGWKEILQRFGARANNQLRQAAGAEEPDENAVQTKELYKRAIVNLNNKLEKAMANLPDNQAVSAYDLDYKLQYQNQSGVATFTGQPKPGQTGQINEGSEFQVQLQHTIDHPLGDVINLWALKRAYGHVMTNIDDYSSKLIQGSYLNIQSLDYAPLEFADQFLKPLLLDDVKKQFLNDRRLSPQQRAAIQNMTQGSPTYMMYVGMAKLLRVMDVLIKLKTDLSRVPSAIDAAIRYQETNSDAQRRTSPQAIQEAARGWAKWNGRILQMIQRVKDEYQSLSSGVSQTSRNEPV